MPTTNSGSLFTTNDSGAFEFGIVQGMPHHPPITDMPAISDSWYASGQVGGAIYEMDGQIPMNSFSNFSF